MGLDMIRSMLGFHAIQEFASSSWNCHLQGGDQSFFSIQRQFLWKLHWEKKWVLGLGGVPARGQYEE